jgi:hypothetical protein
LKQKLKDGIHAAHNVLKTLLSIFWKGALLIGLLSIIFFLFKTLLNSSRIDGTVYNSFFSISFYNIFENFVASFGIVFIIHIFFIVSLVMLERVLAKETTKMQAYSWKLFIPLWVTLWLSMSLDEASFTIMTSVVSFLALLSPLIKTPKLGYELELEDKD